MSQYLSWWRSQLSLQQGVNELGLPILWANPDNDPQCSIELVDYTTHLHTVRDTHAYSVIDHFAMSPQVYDAVSEAGVLHDGSNLSNHSPIYVKLNVGEFDMKLEAISSEARSSWSKANEDAKLHYKETLKEKLVLIDIQPELLGCRNLHCKDQEDSLEEYTMQVLESIEKADKECLPTVGGATLGKKKPIPGWSEHVRPYKDESMFWHSTWLSLGKPMQGDIYNNMRHSKNQYKYAVRRLMRAQNKVQNNKFVSSILEGGVDIF